MSWSSVLNWLLSLRRARAVDMRHQSMVLADELDKVADLLSALLDATEPNGRVRTEAIPELETRRKRVWNRWVAVLSTDGLASQSPAVQAEVDRCIRIAHSAPGAYIEEVLLVQSGLAEGHVSKVLRERFARSIHQISDVATRLRLNS